MNSREIAVRVLPPKAKRRILRHYRQFCDAVVQVRIRTGHVGPLPSFLIIGFGKCGTTELYDRLVEHPNIRSAVRKEVNYFMYRHGEGEDWYRAHFPTPPTNDDHDPFVVGEASPGYVLNPFAPRRIMELVPNVKLIVLLRDPVARAYSHYNHMRRLGAEPLETFEQALEAEPDRLRGERERVYGDPNYRGFAWYVRSYTTQGLYADYLPMWMDTFPREQLLIVQSEEFFRDQAATLQKITRLLELPDWPWARRRGHKAFSYPDMQSETRKHLEEFFAPHNERLYRLLGVDYGWNNQTKPNGSSISSIGATAFGPDGV
jgi:hypothetical protein